MIICPETSGNLAFMLKKHALRVVFHNRDEEYILTKKNQSGK